MTAQAHALGAEPIGTVTGNANVRHFVQSAEHKVLSALAHIREDAVAVLTGRVTSGLTRSIDLSVATVTGTFIWGYAIAVFADRIIADRFADPLGDGGMSLVTLALVWTDTRPVLTRWITDWNTLSILHRIT